jgi:predicted nucleic acid-binding protein
MKILIDADALIAISKLDDSNHKKAVDIAKQLENNFIYITQYTVPEAVTVMSHRVSQKAASLFLERLRNENFIEIQLSQKLKNSTDKIFLEQKTKGTSWVDCLNVASMKSENIDMIFSFDKFYEKIGLKVLN